MKDKPVVLTDRPARPIWEQNGNRTGNISPMRLRCTCVGQYRNCLAIKAFKYHRNVFPIPRVWQTYRTQNPVLRRGVGSSPTLGITDILTAAEMPFAHSEGQGSVLSRPCIMRRRMTAISSIASPAPTSTWAVISSAHSLLRPRREWSGSNRGNRCNSRRKRVVAGARSRKSRGQIEQTARQAFP